MKRQQRGGTRANGNGPGDDAQIASRDVVSPPGDPEAMAKACADVDPGIRLRPIRADYLEVKAIVCAFNITGYEHTLLAIGAPPRVSTRKIREGTARAEALARELATVSMEHYIHDLTDAMKKAYAIFSSETKDVGQERAFATIVNNLVIIANHIQDHRQKRTPRR